MIITGTKDGFDVIYKSLQNGEFFQENAFLSIEHGENLKLMIKPIAINVICLACK